MSRGCPYSCKFCTVVSFNGKALRKKSPEQVIHEVEEIIKLGKSPLRIMDKDDAGRKKPLAVNLIFFTDDNFAIDRKHALAVSEALRKFQEERGAHILEQIWPF